MRWNLELRIGGRLAVGGLDALEQALVARVLGVELLSKAVYDVRQLLLCALEMGNLDLEGLEAGFVRHAGFLCRCGGHASSVQAGADSAPSVRT